MKKALFISSRSLYPLVGGEKIRTAQSLKFLSKWYEVDVVCIADNKSYELGDLSTYISKYYHFYVPKWIHYIWTTRFLFNSDPLQVNYYYSPSVQKFIKRIIDNYDIVFCNNIRTAKYCLSVSGVVKCIDFVDSIAMNYMRAKKKCWGIKKMIYSIDAYRCNAYEQKLLGVFDRFAIISDVDRQFILGKNHSRCVYIVNNAVNIGDGKCVQMDNCNLMFIGKMDYEPNVVAVRNFVNHILPSIEKVYPNVKFYIVGAAPTKAVRALKKENVVVTGFVESVTDYMCRASIVVAPMLTGAGVQNKILQAMALGCCVVTTSVGAEGLVINNEEIAVVDGNKEMTAKILYLLENKKIRVQMGERAKLYVKDNLSESKIGEVFKDFVCGWEVEK